MENAMDADLKSYLDVRFESIHVAQTEIKQSVEKMSDKLDEHGKQLSAGTVEMAALKAQPEKCMREVDNKVTIVAQKQTIRFYTFIVPILLGLVGALLGTFVFSPRAASTPTSVKAMQRSALVAPEIERQKNIKKNK